MQVLVFTILARPPPPPHLYHNAAPSLSSFSSTYYPPTVPTESVIMSQANGSFQCDNCPRRYKRIDYLIRHKRSRTLALVRLVRK
jgi:hypothetical protein